MDTAFIRGQMGGSTKDFMNKIRNKAMEFTPGATAVVMKATGSRASSMERASTSYQTVLRDLVFGSTASANSGLTIPSQSHPLR
jgi:hypothetical protein